MSTYDFTKGAGAISNISVGKHFVEAIPIVVADIIASNATLIANAKITAADIIQLWDIPAKTVIKSLVFEIVVPGTAAGTADIGLAGGTEAFAAIALDSAVGTQTINLVSVAWGPDTVAGKLITTTDTLDIQFIADETIGSFILYVEGFMLR